MSNKGEEVWIPEEHPVSRPIPSIHKPECGSYPDGCCPWMPEPCDCQCICDIIDAVEARVRAEDVEKIFSLVPKTHIKLTAKSEDFNPLICWNCQIEGALEEAMRLILGKDRKWRWRRK